MAKIRSPEKAHLEPSLEDLYRRPGFMIRRAHQIAIDVFIATCSPVDVTPSQYGVMYILNLGGPMSQIDVSRLIGLDRSTTALVIRILTERGLLMKTKSETDARKAEISLTTQGKRLFRQAERHAAREMKALLVPFSATEAKQFLGLLDKFVGHFNENTRVSIVSRLPLD
jgi:DNA-binding MarR family transcriptional regulator